MDEVATNNYQPKPGQRLDQLTIDLLLSVS